MLKQFVIAAMFAGAAHAQSNYTWQDAGNGDPLPAGIGGVSGTTNLGPGLMVFNDLGSFQAAAPAATNSEDFEDNSNPAGPTNCTEPVNSASNDICFTPGQIVDGIEITSSGANGIILLPQGFNGLPSDVVGANTFADTTSLSFTAGDVQAVAMDVYAGLAPSDVTLTVFDTGGGMLGSATIMGLGALPDSGFIGFVSVAPIGEVVIESLGGNGELFDNLLFGAAGADLPDPPAVPALQSTGLMVLILVLAVGSLLLLARRNKANS